MTPEDSAGNGLVKKPTSPELAAVLSASCSNEDGSGKPWRRHVTLVNGRPTRELVKAVLKGLRRQPEADGVPNAAVYILGGGAMPDEGFFPREQNQEAFCPSSVESGSEVIYYDANTEWCWTTTK